MGFVKTFEQIMGNTRATTDFYDAEMLMVYWETKPEIIAKLLPPPLKPSAHPIAMAFVADYPSTNFDVSYRESALFVRAVHNGEEGGAFDYNPRLVSQETVLKPKEMQFGEAEIILKYSDCDPWAEVEVVKMLGAMYTKGDNSMLAGNVVAEVGMMEFAQYAFLKWDAK